MRTIAGELGLSVATVSRGLRRDPSVRPETRELIFRKAEELGYELNTYVGGLMSSIRRGQAQTFKGNLGVLWGGPIPSDDSDPRLLQIRSGVSASAEALGYSVSEFSLSGRNPEALSRVLQSRGVQGLLISVPAFSAQKAYVRFDFDRFCTICLGWGLLRPVLHTVRFDYFHAVRLALHHARHAFGGRIAAIWDRPTDRRAHSIARGAFVIHHPAGPCTAQKLFLEAKNLHPGRTLALLARHRVECLLIERGVEMPDWLEARFATENCIFFKDPGETRSFGWIDTQNTLMGSWGAELLASKLSQHERGIPAMRQVLLVPPEWRAGRR